MYSVNEKNYEYNWEVDKIKRLPHIYIYILFPLSRAFFKITSRWNNFNTQTLIKSYIHSKFTSLTIIKTERIHLDSYIKHILNIRISDLIYFDLCGYRCMIDRGLGRPINYIIYAILMNTYSRQFF